MVLNQAKIVQKLKNLPKTQGKISKNLKFPANPLPYICRKIVKKKPDICSSLDDFISVLTSISEAEETELSLDGLSKSLLAGLVSGDRASLARSITLVESTHPVKAAQARKLVTHATRHYRNNGLQSFRLGLSGPPGTRLF